LVLIFIKSLYIFGEINLFFSLVQNSDVDSGRIDSDSFQFSPSAVILLVISAVTILFCLGKFS
jgi:hypothetical protein